jgi:hypothetical protein
MMHRVLVLAHSFDAGAMAVVAKLQREPAMPPICVIAPEQLSLARWSHRIDERGSASTTVVVPGGERIDSREVAAVWNRIRYLPQPAFRNAPEKDIGYAAAELQAVMASWLGALGDKVLPDMRRTLWEAPTPHPLPWLLLAGKFGIPSAKSSLYSASLRLLLAGDEVVGSVAPRHEAACRAVARHLGHGLIEFVFCEEEGESRLLRIDAAPALKEAAAVDAASRLLQRMSGRATA